MTRLFLAAAFTAVAATAGATSTSVTTSATTPTLPNLCEFSDITAGTMSWNEATNVFDNIVAPTLTMKVRDVIEVTVNTNKAVYDTGANTLSDVLSSVTYSGSSATPQDSARSLTTVVGTDNFRVNGFDAPQFFDMVIDHTAVPSSTFVAKSNTTYQLTHTITCAY